MGFGHGGDADLIHACQKGGKKGQLRVIGPDEECKRDEIAVVWNIQGIQGDPGADGADGEPCSVANNGDDTFTMACPDETSVTWAGVAVSAPQDCSQIGPGADLSGCSLAEVELATANLTGANLTGAYLFGTVLTYANLTDANLTNAEMTYANLTYANLTYANLTGAWLGGTVLTGANLTGATLTDVVWGNTTCPDGTESDTNETSPESCEGHLG